MTYNLHIPQHLPAIVGINEAHILSQLRHFINLGKDDGISTDDDGRLWLAKKYSAWAKIFTWIKEDTIGRLFNKLKRLGYLDIRQCGSKNCFSLTKQGADLFDDYVAKPETRRFSESAPETDPQDGNYPPKTRKKAAGDTEIFRPLSIYNINNLIKDSDKAIDSLKHSPENQQLADWWLACLGTYELQLNRATYDTWIRDLKFSSHADNTLTLFTRDSYAQEWLSKRLAQSIMKLFAGIAAVEVDHLILTAPNCQNVAVQRTNAGHYTPAKPPAGRATINQPALVS